MTSRTTFIVEMPESVAARFNKNAAAPEFAPLRRILTSTGTRLEHSFGEFFTLVASGATPLSEKKGNAVLAQIAAEPKLDGIIESAYAKPPGSSPG